MMDNNNFWLWFWIIVAITTITIVTIASVTKTVETDEQKLNEVRYDCYQTAQNYRTITIEQCNLLR